MSDAPIAAANFDFAVDVERNYTALLRTAGISDQPEPSLGGKLLYTGDLVPGGRALLAAGNIAGAASLAASADPIAQKQAIRDGVADFLVTSLDEALRILKNEIRKREAVAVCVAVAPEAMEREMQGRGVLPDLFGSALMHARVSDGPVRLTLAAWSVAASPAKWLPKLDALALDCFCGETNADAGTTRRWLRLSPRYLGRLAQGFRLLHGTQEAAKEFIARVQDAVAHKKVGVAVRVSLNRDAEVHVVAPSAGAAPQFAD